MCPALDVPSALSAPAGSYLQATYLAGTLYEKARQRHGDHVTCKGIDCFQVVFLINAGMAVVAVVTSVLLWHRTRGLYHKVIEVTKAERAKRGLQVRRSVHMARMARPPHLNSARHAPCYNHVKLHWSVSERDGTHVTLLRVSRGNLRRQGLS